MRCINESCRRLIRPQTQKDDTKHQLCSICRASKELIRKYDYNPEKGKIIKVGRKKVGRPKGTTNARLIARKIIEDMR